MASFGEVSEENKVRHQALVDNTAQGIFNYLKDVENKREIYEKRWIWELFQNALDVAPPDRKVNIEITIDDNQLIFKHNGRPFRMEEVAHLIYHGSTKKQLEIGKFGKGFLTTHLLSRKVRVKGIREDHKKFNFLLDRSGNSADQMKDLMEKTWKEYQSSLRESEEKQLFFTTEYTYPLNDSSLSIAMVGVKEFAKIAPYVLAFNDQLGAVKTKSQDHVVSFRKEDESITDIGIIYIKIKKEMESDHPITYTMCIVRNSDVEIAIPLTVLKSGNYQIEDVHDSIPKVFLAFPLFSTEDLPFPVVVSSKKFEPTDKRDGIFLGKEKTADIELNRRLFRSAKELFIKFVSNPEVDRWENVHTLLHLGLPPDKDWLDKDWYIDYLKNFIYEIMNSRVLRTDNGNSILLKEGFIPYVESQEKVEEFWSLCNRFSAIKNKIPARRFAVEWAQIIRQWESLGLDLSERKITIEKLAEELEESGTLQFFRSKLEGVEVEIDFLNDLCKLLLDIKKVELFDHKNILPNQNGTLSRKPELYKDGGIGEVLKDISHKLGIDVRATLLHSGILEDVQKLLQIKGQHEILNQAATLIKQQPNQENTQYIQANIELFNWLLENNKFEYFEGYPLISSKDNTFIKLSKENKEKPLAPKEVWNERAMIYADLFPQEFIISSLYYEKISQKDKWNILETENLVLNNPLYREREKILEDDLDHLLLSEEKLEEESDHEIIEDVEVSKIAFLEIRDKGIIDTVRKSKEKARKFLRFLFEYTIEADSVWNSPFEFNCKCGSKHRIFTAYWIAPLRKRAWVPVRKDKSEKPSSQYLALLLEGHKDLLQLCRQDKPLRLLTILNTSISELLMQVVAKDSEARLELDKAVGSLCTTFMTDPSKLSKIAQLAEIEPELFLQQIEERIQIREQVLRNQSIGFLVEKLLKDALEKEGFMVEATGVGSDFVVEHDFISNNIEQVLKVEKKEKTYLYLEVKSTYQEFIRMTFAQAKEARGKSNRYALCVIRLDGSEINEENIKKNAKFVIDIGERIKDKVSKAEDFKGEQDALVETGDIEIEISEGPIRFKINEKVWNEGKTFKGFLEYLKVKEITQE